MIRRALLTLALAASAGLWLGPTLAGGVYATRNAEVPW